MGKMGQRRSKKLKKGGRRPSNQEKNLFDRSRRMDVVLRRKKGGTQASWYSGTKSPLAQWQGLVSRLINGITPLTGNLCAERKDHSAKENMGCRLDLEGRRPRGVTSWFCSLL